MGASVDVLGNIREFAVMFCDRDEPGETRLRVESLNVERVVRAEGTDRRVVSVRLVVGMTVVE